MPKQDSDAPPSALDYLRILRRRKWWLVASVVLLTAAAFGYSHSEPKRYTATASVLVLGMPVISATNGVTQAPAGSVGTSTQVQVLTSSTISDAVKRSIGTAGSITATAVGTTNAINIVAVASTPRQAARVANAYAQAYVSHESGEVTTRITAVEKQLAGRLSALKSLIATYEYQIGLSNSSSTTTGSIPVTTQVLEAQLQAALSDQGVVQGDLEQLQAAGGSTAAAQINSVATPPTGPSSPKTKRNLAGGFGAGLLVGMALCVFVDAIDDRIRSKTDLEAVLGDIPVLGLIPSVPLWKSPDKPFVVSVSSPQSVAAESYRSLRTALQFVLLDKGVKRVLVSSAIMGEGKSATTANLGVAMARAGHEVLVVSADLRRPRLGEFLGCDESTGLSSIALGTMGWNEAVRPVPGVRGLWFLGTGPIPPDPAEFLASRSVVQIMADAAERFDLVLIDCAPVVPVADTLAASEWSDAVVLVVRADVTRRRHPRHAIELLGTSNAKICGAIFNDATRAEGGYRGARYGRYRGYGGYGGYAYYGGYGPRHRRDRKSEITAGDQGAPSSDSAPASDVG